MKLTDYTDACNSLTNFECNAHPFSRNGNPESCFKKFVKSKLIEVNLFLAGFIHLESLCDAENLKLHL